jgi:hypothetical protein
MILAHLVSFPVNDLQNLTSGNLLAHTLGGVLQRFVKNQGKFGANRCIVGN